MNSKSHQPTVHRCPGVLPPFRDDSVMFFANLFSLFFGNEAQTQALRREIQGVKAYGGRLVPIIDLLFKGSDNLLIVEQAPDPGLCQYFENELHVPLPDIEVVDFNRMLGLGHDERDELLEHMRCHPAELVDGFVTDDQLERLAMLAGKPTLSSAQGSREGNNKLLLHRHLEAIGQPVMETFTAVDPGDVLDHLAVLSAQGFDQAVLKSQIGASGIGLVKLKTQGTLGAAIPDYLFYQGPCIVQGWVRPAMFGIEEIHSPSVQLYIANEDVYLYDVTDQILSHESIHEGNFAIPPYIAEDAALLDTLLDQAEACARWLHHLGYRGTASADFILLEKTSGRDVYVCEVNARVTGATYPSLLSRHVMPEGTWLMRNLVLQRPCSTAELLDRLETAGFLYQRNSLRGLLPFNLSHGPDGLIIKGQFIFIAASAQACLDFVEETERWHGIDWEYDRD